MQKASTELKREVRAIDEGGPEKQFLSEVWQMLPSLEVSVPGSHRCIKLFELTEDGYCPTRDDCISDDVNDDKYREAKEKVGLFYRAIGRIFAYCVCRGHPIPDQVLPKLFCNGTLAWNAVVLLFP